MMNTCKKFNIHIKYDKKQNAYLDIDAYFLLLEESCDTYTVIEQSKKLIGIIKTLNKDIEVEFKVDLNEDNSKQIIYWIAFYIYYSRFTDKKSEIREGFTFNATALSSEIINSLLEKCKKESEIVSDFHILLNKQNNEIHPGNFSMFLIKYLKKYDVNFKITDLICDESSQFRGIYSIGKSGEHLPKLIKIDIEGINSDRQICLIGKGITYDTGGYNTKPWRYMLGMHKDKAGSLFALFTGILLYVNEGISSTILLAVAENKISRNAVCPGDVILNYDNIPIQIVHTDAEGRVVLSDAISYACKHISFEYMFTFATLTGVAELILGPDTGINITNSQKAAEIFNEQSFLYGERVCNLPLTKWQKQFIEFDYNGVTGVKNSSDSSHADTITAGAFLYNFFKSDKNFVHWDLAALFDKDLVEGHSAAYLLPYMSSVIDKLIQ